MERRKFDVVIVGAGPAGLFTALELVKHGGLELLIVDKGPDLEERKCPALGGRACLRCPTCSLLSGWGGAGAFSDGKLTYSPDVGGWLSSLVGKEELMGLLKEVDDIYLRFGAPRKLYGTDEDLVAEIARRASKAGLRLVPQKVRHMGTDGCLRILRRIRSYLEGRVEIWMRTEASSILTEAGRARGIRLANGEEVRAKYVVLAPGRGGTEWLKSLAHQLNIKVHANPVDVGVRVEVPSVVAEELTDALYEPKLVYYSKRFDDKVRTFCVAPHGHVIMEYYDGIITVNGQSYADRSLWTDNTNFAILVSSEFTEPFEDPIAYGKHIAALTNLISSGVLVQRLSDLLMGRRSTPERVERSIVKPTLPSATPGDLAYVLPYRFLADILEMLKALDALMPGVFSRHTLLYGAEVKFYSLRIEVDRHLETPIKGLFAAGDGVGLTRGLAQASASGLLVAREIARREGALA
ncbi:MAG TPA: NAD(P)/FAD-dependent oxidoreductase [Candidatus Bathyarchaeota archaeon]|nr:NAD(P)/FAD-dependent oxidoreductase [Candidatus Bathyarchaeota archaeon]